MNIENVNDSQVAIDGGSIKNSKINNKKKEKTNNFSVAVWFSATGAGFIGGLIASIIANLICG